MPTGFDPTRVEDPLAFLQGGGAMGERIRSHDWQHSELGLPERWPTALKSAISSVLNSGTAMHVSWGDNLLQFYNDAYTPILSGGKHPAALGRSVRESFPEIWDFIWPLFERVLINGESIAMENTCLMLSRDGQLQESFFSFSYSPLKSLAGKVCGVASVVWETTEEVIIKRRERGLLLLTEQLAAATTLEEIRHAVCRHVEGNRGDLPFLLWYERDEVLKTLRLVMSCGISAEAPLVRELGEQDSRSRLGRAIDASAPVARLLCLPEPVTDWLLDPPPAMDVESIAIEPLYYVDFSTPDAYLVFGVGAQRPFDDACKYFLVNICHGVEQAVRRISAVDLDRRESLRQFDAVTAVVPSLVWMSNAEGVRTFVSKRWLDFTGRTEPESLADAWKRGIHPDDQADVEEARRVAFANHAPLNMEYRFLRADGQYRWMLDQGVPRHDELGNFLGIVGSSLDITERRQAQLELQEAKQTLEQTVVELEHGQQRLLNAQRVAKVGSWETDLATGSVTWSDETHRIHETQPGDFLPTNALVLLLVHPEDRARVEKAFAESIERGDDGGTEHRLLLPSGLIKHVEQRWHIEFDAKRTPVRALGTCQDVSEREKTEARLRLLNSAVLQSTEAVLITDAELDTPGPRIVFANPAFTRMTGYGLDEILGRTPRILQGPRTDPAVLRRLRAELERGKTFYGGAVNYRKDGSEYEQEWEVAPIRDAQGNTTHYVAVLRDVTERNRAAQALLDGNREQRQLAEQLEQERQRLLDAQRVANIGSWETDLVSGSVIWSEETHRIHETQPGAFLPTHPYFLQLVHPDDRERVDQALADSVERGDGGVIEHRLLLPDGRIKHVEERWQIESDAKQVPVRALGTCQDVSERKQAESVLRNTSDRLAQATQSAQIGIWDWDVVDNTLVWDAQMLRLYGLDEREFGKVYEAWTQCLHPDDRERVQAEISDAIAGKGEYRTRFRINCPDGRLRDIEANGLVQRAADGTALRMIGANRDISEQMQADRRIRYLNRVHAMMSSVNALIVRADTRDELFQQACRIAVEAGGFHVAILGMVVPGGLDYVAMAGASEDSMCVFRELLAKRDATPTAMAARALQDRIACVSNASQSDPQAAYPEMQARFGIQSIAIIPLLVDGAPVGVLSLSAVEGDFFQAEEITLLTELAGNIALAVDHLDNRDRLAFLAYYDALTGLANRSLFLERVGQYGRSAGSAGQQLAVLIFDLERFKNINDSLGRDAGDDLLRQVAAWLTMHLGDVNLLARIDADHFGLVLPAGEGSGYFANVIERMMAAFLRNSFDVKGETLRIAARAGIAIYPADGEDAEALFRRAEAALKEANASGARYLFYAQQMTDAVAGRLALESQLRNALENGEFVLYYQPKVDLLSGLLSGAEALIRWNNPRTGLIPPGLFIPILEETGMINDVGRWALQQAITDWMRWRQAGLRAVPIAVNVSPLQLRDPAFISQLEQAVSVAEGAAQGLELEITESMIMDDVKQSIASLKAIRAMGIRVAIDDFGTGFSSLGYLGKLPIDTLKIDRTFIVDMGISVDGLSMVSTMLTLAHALKLKVVAEGVETAEQASQLGLLECDEIQGYLVSPPLPCADFEARFLATAWRMR